ncbi:band 7 [Micractinium conductrix]|uniref:Band 7 n=1 Tax=Micractinium conductrix TaxID=554055 RepID=A0A2P6V850_9CHLO|nr:band 7 [Micractinium conductrix]|eukprot:PSC70261.1 band 7 [Micractinium conductrix]
MPTGRPLLALRLALAAAVVAAAAAAAAQPIASPLWGEAGELWRPDGPFMDFSYAGYRNGDVPLPSPPVSRTLDQFRQPGLNDSAALAAMVAWGNAQPASAGWVVLGLPEGQLTLDRQLSLNRSQTVLRGAGRGRTVLYITKSMMDLFGPAPYHPDGYWVWYGGLLSAVGETNQTWLAKVNATPPVPRGSNKFLVDNVGKLAVGQTVSLLYNGGNGTFKHEIMNNKLDPGEKYDVNDGWLSSRILAINGKEVTLERAVPWNIREEYEPALITRVPAMADVGFEGFTMEFAWTPYMGHHLEQGLNGIQFDGVADAWVRDVAIVNCDSGILTENSERLTLTNFTVETTKPRWQGVMQDDPPKGTKFDGHWGTRVALGSDVLVQNFDMKAHLLHSAGADSHGMFSVHHSGRCDACTLEMHRAQSTQCLFTDIDVGSPETALYNGGPVSSGPNTGAWTAYWNIRSATGSLPPPQSSDGSPPGSCVFGPDLTFVGVTFNTTSSTPGAPPYTLCPGWIVQQGEVAPPNLYLAQLQRRQRLQAEGKPAAVAERGPAVGDVEAPAPAPAQAAVPEAAPVGAPAPAATL